MLFVVEGQFKSGAEVQRLAIHEQFNEHLQQPPTPVRFGGPLYDENGGRVGVLLVIEAVDLEAAKRFLVNSPYSQAGLYERTDIKEIRPEVGYLR